MKGGEVMNGEKRRYAQEEHVSKEKKQSIWKKIKKGKIKM